MKTLVAPLLFIISLTTFAQSEQDTLGNIYDDLFKRNKGSIRLLSGSTIEGYIDYNFYNGTLRLNDDLNYIAGDVKGFEYVDEATGKKRSFTSQYVTFSNESLNGKYFLEILCNAKNTTLLSLTMPMAVERRTGRPTNGYVTPYGMPADHHVTRDKLITEHTVLIYFRIDEALHPYLVHKTKEIDDLSGTSLTGGRKRSSVKVLDASLPEKIMGNKYQEVKKYASKNHLNWTDHDELVAILTFYKDL